MARSLQHLELELLHEDPDENEDPNQDMVVDVGMGAEDTGDGNEGMFYSAPQNRSQSQWVGSGTALKGCKMHCISNHNQGR